ncbi:IAA-alanine resistance protein 1 [Platanthera zijinensis]|uniref:IAA-alanine resistance protein 1 n=1 Tax=Platanthera zijinensis TaxID=2320716 RepID=A0AAP0BR22_9ASPA
MFGKFSKVVREVSFKQSSADSSLFTRHQSTETIILLVYVDDILITGDDSIGIQYRKYCIDLLQDADLSGCKPADTSMEVNHMLCAQGSNEDSLLPNPEYYRRLVGKLIYLTVTRPDISFVVGVVSRFMHTPRVSHLQAVKRILGYLKTSPGQGLVYKPSSSLSLIAYSDSDYAGSLDDRRSTTGFCTYFGGNLITWQSKKQTVVSRSSAEAEYLAMTAVTSELTWLGSLLGDLGVKLSSPPTLFCDCQAAIHIAKNPVFHERTKYIEVDCHFVLEKVQSKELTLEHVPASGQVVDVLTKALPRKLYCQFLSKLGLFSFSSLIYSYSLLYFTHEILVGRSSEMIVESCFLFSKGDMLDHAAMVEALSGWGRRNGAGAPLGPLSHLSGSLFHSNACHQNFGGREKHRIELHSHLMAGLNVGVFVLSFHGLNIPRFLRVEKIGRDAHKLNRKNNPHIHRTYLHESCDLCGILFSTLGLEHKETVCLRLIRTSDAASDGSDVDSRTFQDIQKKPSLNETVSVHPSSNLVFGYLNLFSDGVHNFTDGMALGSAFLLHGPVGGWSRTLFLLAHELPQEVGDFGILVRSGFSVSKALFFNFLSALVALSGTALALVLGKDPGQSSLIEGFIFSSFLWHAVWGPLRQLHNSRTSMRNAIRGFLSDLVGMSRALRIELAN